eukprot:1369735-Amorphochlora_amoeboformis.AAC.1
MALTTSFLGGKSRNRKEALCTGSVGSQNWKAGLRVMAVTLLRHRSSDLTRVLGIHTEPKSILMQTCHLL